jgi:hypothetical protein
MPTDQGDALLHEPFYSRAQLQEALQQQARWLVPRMVIVRRDGRTSECLPILEIVQSGDGLTVYVGPPSER